MKPQLKIVVNSNDITSESVNASVVRQINAISYASLTINDYFGRNYIDNINQWNTIDIYMDYVDASTKVFSGIITKVGPQTTIDGGAILTAEARGLGFGLLSTHCNKLYGTETPNPELEDPDEIWADVIANFVNQSFGGTATGHTLTTTYINVRPTPNINYLNTAYKTNYDVVCEVLKIRQGAAGSAIASDQFFVDTSGNFRVKAVNESQTGWSRWWKGTTAAESTITEGANIIFNNFHKTGDDYANKIIYYGTLRKPAYDSWTENKSGDWGSENCVLTDDIGGDAGEPADAVVGTHFLKASSSIDGTCYFFYPDTADAGWDFTKLGTPQNPPTLNFQLSCTDISDSVQIGVNLFTTRGTDFFAYVDKNAAVTLQNELSADNEFQFITIPIGPYAQRYFDKKATYHWTVAGTPDWSNINGIEIQFDGTADRNAIHVDDLHFSGNLVRIAYNSTAIASVGYEIQKVIQDNTSHDDMMVAADDSGTAALLAKGELVRCLTTPTVGQITLPGIETILPGQNIHLHTRQTISGAYRIDSDFRVTKILHIFDGSGFKTTLDVTSDMLSSFPKTVPDQAAIISKYALMGHSEAKNLKASGLDVLVEQLSVDYA